MSKGKQINNEDFLNKIKIKFGNEILDEYTFLEKYQKANTKMLIRHNCEKCDNYEYKVTPHKFLQGRRCPKCAGKTRNTEQFKQEVYNLVGEEYTILGEYTGAFKKIKVKHNCDKCDNYEYEVVPSSFLRGSRCPKCAGTQLKSQEQFEEEVFSLVGDEYSVLGEYINTNTKIKVKHNCEKCNNYKYEVRPSEFLKGTRCPKCFELNKRNNDSFKKEAYDLVGEEYTFLEEYIDSTTKIKVRHNCKKCNNYEYNVNPSNFLRGSRCPKCFRLSKKRTKEEFIQEVYDLVGEEYTFLEEYIDSTTKIKVKHNCEKCNNYEYNVKPNSFLQGSRCPKCFGNIKKTTQKFKNEVYSLVDDEYSVLGEYINNNTKIRVRHNCKDCDNYEYEVIPSQFLQGSRCPKCFGNSLKTHDEFIQEVYDLVREEYTFLGEYINAQIKIKVKHNCKDCDNYEYEVTPHKFLQGSRCPKCAGTQLKSQEQFEEEVFNLVGDEYTILGKYINTNTKIKVKHNCEKCNYHEWDVLPSNFLRGTRCPICNESKGEKYIFNYIKSKNINYKNQYKIAECKNINLLPFDFAIFNNENNLLGLIEYDGEQHFKAIDIFGGEKNLKETRKRDNIKTTYCEKNNIPLLRIKYTQIDIIEEILDDFLKDPSRYVTNHFYNMTKEEYYSELYENLENEGEY